MSPPANEPIFLGFEVSTQQLKVIGIDNKLNIAYEDTLGFDQDLQEFNTVGGVHIQDDNLTVTAPTLMWVKALDVVLARMTSKGFDFKAVVALSGTGQQHGSVYWKTGSSDILSAMNSTDTLENQLKNAFSVSDSPIWMDSSTTDICKQVEQAVGGAQTLADITGSRAYERFTGIQIAKIFQTQASCYKDTERISLISSFACSLFLDQYAPIDHSDGSGMNLLDIKSKTWSKSCLEACAPDLEDKLGVPVPSYECVGDISQYMVERYNFSPNCKVIAFTGDNPASVAGMRLATGDVIISLGTSDTLFSWINEPRPSLQGHVLINPVDDDAYMNMLVYKNGSLMRVRIRNECAGRSWENFENHLNNTPPGNDGCIGIYYDIQEITPSALGRIRFDNSNQQVEEFPPAVEARALIEGQFMAKRVHAERMGYTVGATSRVLATGGASVNAAMLQILADVFNAPVFTQDVANSACLGCAYRAKHGLMDGTRTPFSDVVKEAPEFVCVAKPNPDAEKIYSPLLKRYQGCEDTLVDLWTASQLEAELADDD